MTLAEAKGLLAQAISSPIGLLLRTNDITRARARFYAAQRQMPEASDLQLRGSPWPDEGQLVIVRRHPGSPDSPDSPISLPDLGIS